MVSARISAVFRGEDPTKGSDFDSLAELKKLHKGESIAQTEVDSKKAEILRRANK